MKLFFFFLVATCMWFKVEAQKKPEFHSQNLVGILEGEEGSKFQFQTINGFRWKTWFLGAGTGIDYYLFRSVPLFLSVNKNFCDCNRSFFLSADAGMNWVWDKNKINGFTWRNSDYSPAPYWGTGMGYRVGLKSNKDAVLLHLGYSNKRVKESIRTTTNCFMPPCPETTEVYRYHLNRLSLKVGWEF